MLRYKEFLWYLFLFQQWSRNCLFVLRITILYPNIEVCLALTHKIPLLCSSTSWNYVYFENLFKLKNIIIWEFVVYRTIYYRYFWIFFIKCWNLKKINNSEPDNEILWIILTLFILKDSLRNSVLALDLVISSLLLICSR